MLREWRGLLSSEEGGGGQGPGGFLRGGGRRDGAEHFFLEATEIPTNHEPLPKGPFRTKKTTTIAKVVNYHAVVFLLRPPDSLRRGPFSERENVCNSRENGVCTRCAATANHRAIVKILRVVNLLRVVFLVRPGPWGYLAFLEGPLSTMAGCRLKFFGGTS